MATRSLTDNMAGEVIIDVDLVTVELRPDEVAYLRESARCPDCGHLEALHNYHCCTQCMVCGKKWCDT